MIKTIKKSVYGFMLGLLAFSCADPDLNPILTFDILGKGGYPRLVTLTSAEYDLNNLANTAFVYEVEFVTIDQGKNVASYEILASYNGGTAVQILNATQSDLTTNAKGFRGISVNIALTAVAADLGVDVNTMQAGDYILFDSFVTLNDGSRFGQENSTSAVNGSAFAGFFRNTVNITCPLADDKYAGEYAVTYEDALDAPNCFTGARPTLRDDITNVNLALISGSSTKRRISGVDGNIPWALSGFNYGSGVIEFVCDKVVLIDDFNLNGSCGGSINLTGAGGDALLDLDLSNDASFELTVNEFSNGECGCDEIEFTLIFTKI